MLTPGGRWSPWKARRSGSGPESACPPQGCTRRMAPGCPRHPPSPPGPLPAVAPLMSPTRHSDPTVPPRGVADRPPPPRRTQGTAPPAAGLCARAPTDRGKKAGPRKLIGFRGRTNGAIASLPPPNSTRPTEPLPLIRGTLAVPEGTTGGPADQGCGRHRVLPGSVWARGVRTASWWSALPQTGPGCGPEGNQDRARHTLRDPRQPAARK